MKLLDLFCGAGGAGEGYRRAGFDVVGVDLAPQPRYPFEFHRGDALAFLRKYGHEFDAIHASPPCQKYSALRSLHPTRSYPDLIPRTRASLKATGKPFVIENVPRAPLREPVILCGSSFGLLVRRHRGFEANFRIPPLECRHYQQPEPIDVSGTGGRQIKPRTKPGGGRGRKPANLAEAREAIGIDWMTRGELSQAIPPAYTEYVGRALALAVRGDLLRVDL